MRLALITSFFGDARLKMPLELIQRAEAVSGDAMADQLGDHAMGVPTREEGADAPLPFVGNKISQPGIAQTNDYEECLSCQ